MSTPPLPTQGPAGPIRIALADDHALLRRGLAGLIGTMENMRIVAEAGDGQQLLNLLDQIKNPAELPQVCVLDINMPEMNGYETAAAIRDHYPAIRTLALSMYDNEFSVIKMLRSGAAGYVLKNAEPAELSRAITDVHKHGFYHSELVTGRLLRALHDRNTGLLSLTEIEEQFLALCCSELTYKEIADRMFKSPRTVDGYREDLFKRLGITSRTGLVLYALKTGIAPL